MSNAPEVPAKASSRQAYLERNNRLRQRNMNADLNPCVDEQRLSLRCLADHDYQKDACQRFFDNYNQCNGFWNEIRKQRRMNGVKPELPVAEERIKILNEKRLKDQQLLKRIQEIKQQKSQ